MNIGITEIPDEFLQADDKKRWKWINILANTMPLEIKIPLYAAIDPSVAIDVSSKPISIKVALYKKVGCRGKYDEYEYCGDAFT